MINLVVFILLLGSRCFRCSAALASPLSEYEKQLKKEGFDLKVLHEEIKEESREVLKEFGSKTMQTDIALLRADYERAAVHSTNETKEITELEMNNGISGDLYEGDLELTPEQWKAATEADPHNPATRRQALTNFVRMWKPIGQPLIPYNYAPGYPADKKPVVKASIDFWEDRTCVRFRPATSSDKDVLQFNHIADGCSSSVGLRGGVQKINLGNGCHSVTVVAHEISHTFGTLHVQGRSDRDKYVRIDTSNIKEGKAHNFLKEPATGFSHYDIPYEFGSMQHYHEKAFALNSSRPTIYAMKAFEKFQYSMEAPRATFYDTLLVNRMYKCTDKCQKKITCQNNGVQHGSDCKKCFCPRGWAGTNCEKRPADAQTINVENGKEVKVELGKSSGDFIEKLYILKAPAGKKIQTTVTKLGDRYTSMCRSFGMEIIPFNDTRTSGFRFCSEPKQGRITSEGDTMLVWVYTTNYKFYANIAIKLV
ncbi:hypothetical protein PRIPAC_77556 [Pristionchus pacificus]|uniref:Metalloendopeptidase n=1 Tax=Pristionchus pacificus TaxID=54126 RepID=A0A2A6C4Q6_PRIPA|nr:hypothetical protein PRIPAC_77556 [Pristionchus pacificus]|eukprot:PDM73144.1 metallopeptidase [Pristionchus pacificus]